MREREQFEPQFQTKHIRIKRDPAVTGVFGIALFRKPSQFELIFQNIFFHLLFAQFPRISKRAFQRDLKKLLIRTKQGPRYRAKEWCLVLFSKVQSMTTSLPADLQFNTTTGKDQLKFHRKSEQNLQTRKKKKKTVEMSNFWGFFLEGKGETYRQCFTSKIERFRRRLLVPSCLSWQRCRR